MNVNVNVNDLPDHSPLGGSGAYRWIPCPGSVQLSYGVQDATSDYAAEGTVAHSLAETCLRYKTDAWEHIGSHFGEHVVTKEMADAVQVYLDAIRSRYTDANQGNSWIEKFFYCPSIHEHFYGKSDFGYLSESARTLHIWDYKHGAGIVVEVKKNPQLMYYGCGMMEDLNLWDKVDWVVLHIAQPRGFHWDGPIRSWTISTEHLWNWLQFILIPAMDRALTSDHTESGEHCRFCPARARACPQLMSDMTELENFMTKMLSTKNQAPQLTNEEAGRVLDLYDISKIQSEGGSTRGSFGFLGSFGVNVSICITP